MNIIYNLGFILSCNINISFKFYTYFAITQKIIEVIMLQFHPMIGQFYMFLPLIRNLVFFKQYFICILVNFFLKSTS